jgi:GlpG protein
MRQIWIFDRAKQAEACSDFLASQNIANTLMAGDGDAQELWVREETDLPRARELLQEYLADPQASRFQQARKEGRRRKKEQERKVRQPDTILDARTTIFNRSAAVPRGAVTLLLIVVCGAVFVFSKFGEDLFYLRPFLISGTRVLPDQGMVWIPLWESLKNGDLWRLFTPIFIHFGFMHILFNMMWLLDLGSMVEQRRGSFFLVFFVAMISASSNVAQYFFGNPLFGGMSGVNYGLVGYIWMKGRYDPGSGLGLHRNTIVMMVFWYLACLVGIIPNVANAAHTVGFAGGLAWGFLTSLKFRQILARMARKKNDE